VANEVETVLANWIRRATSSEGQLPEGIEPAEWITRHFAEWWRHRASESIADGERAAHQVREELMRLGGWDTCGEALDELIHITDAFGDLRVILGLKD
jgi:hypothetical protein